MRKKLYALYLMHSIDGFAGSLIGVFVPIYLLTTGYPLKEVFAFYVLSQLGVLIFFNLAGIIAARFGLRKTLLCHFPFLLAYLIILYGLKTSHVPLPLLALAGSLNVAFYWFPLHVLFAKKADSGKMGSEVGKLFALPQLFSIGAPFMGGLIAFYFGFEALFVVAMAIFMLSAAPLIYMGEFETKVNLSLKKIIYYFKKYPKYSQLEIVSNIYKEVEAVIWPIFVFLVVKNVLSIGAIGSLLSVGGVLFTLFVGKLSNGDNKSRLFKIGAISLITIWLARMFSQDQVSLYILTAMAGFLGVLISVPFNSIIYEIAQKEDAEDFIIFREILVTIGRVVLYGSAILLASNIKLTFILAILALIPFLSFKIYVHTLHSSRLQQA